MLQRDSWSTNKTDFFWVDSFIRLKNINKVAASKLTVPRFHNVQIITCARFYRASIGYFKCFVTWNISNQSVWRFSQLCSKFEQWRVTIPAIIGWSWKNVRIIFWNIWIVFQRECMLFEHFMQREELVMKYNHNISR